MAVDERRVVQVFAPAGDDGQGVKGSGYLMADGLVLTARHVVEGATGLCEVRALGCPDWVVAGEPLLGDPDCDVALLPVDLADAVPLGEQPPELGRLVTGARVQCDAVGFPWAQLTRDASGPRRRTERIVAELDPLSGLAPGEAPSIVALDVRSSAPAKRRDGSPWAGMSGSVLIAGDLVVGVVILDPARFDTDRLGAV